MLQCTGRYIEPIISVCVCVSVWCTHVLHPCRTDSPFFSPVYTISTESSTVPDLTAWSETSASLPSGHASLPVEHSTNVLCCQGEEGGPKVEEVKILSPEESVVGLQPCALTSTLSVAVENSMALDPWAEREREREREAERERATERDRERERVHHFF